MEFLHRDNGTAKDVLAGLAAKRAELTAGADSRGKALLDASLGAVQRIVSGQADDAQTTITAQVSERTENGKLVVSQLYVDCTIVPASAGDPAPVAVADQAQAAAPTANGAGS